MPAPRKRSSEHSAEHTVDDPVPMVDEKSFDDAPQLLEDCPLRKTCSSRSLRPGAQACERNSVRWKSLLRWLFHASLSKYKVKSKMARMLLLSHCVISMRVANSQGYASADEYRDPEKRHPYAVEQTVRSPRGVHKLSGYEVLSLTGTDSCMLRCGTEIASKCVDTGPVVGLSPIPDRH